MDKKTQTPQKNKKTSSQKKRTSLSRIIRRLLLFLFLIIIVPLTIFVVIFLTTDPIHYFNLVSTQVYQQYNREIKAEEIEISITKGLTLTGISLSESGGFDNGIAIEFQHGSLLYNPIALLKKKLDILNITVGGFYTTYDKLLSIIDDFTPTDDQTKSTTDKQDTDEVSEGKFEMTIREIQVNNSQFLYNDIPLNFEVGLYPSDDLFDYDIDLSIESIHGDITFSGTLHEGDLTVKDLEIGPFLDANIPLQINEVKTKVALKNENYYGITGQTVDIEYKDYHLTCKDDFTGTYDNLSGDVEIRNLNLKVNQAKLTIVSAKYSTKTAFLEADISNIQASIEDFVDDFKGDITGEVLFFYSDQPYITGNIGITNFEYEFVEKANIGLSMDYNRVKGTINVFTPAGDVYTSIQSDHFLNSPYTVKIDSELVEMAPLMEYLAQFSNSGTTNQDSQTEQDSTASADDKEMIPLPRINLTLDIGKFIYDIYEIEDIQASGYYDRQIAVLENFSFDYFNGTLTIDGTYNNNVLSGNINYEKGKLRQLTELMLEDPKKLYGTVSLSGKFRVYLDDIINSVASADVMITDGEIKDFIIQDEISSVLYNIPLNDIFFDEISFYTLFSDNALQLSGFLFYNDDMRITADGDLRLEDMVLDVITTIELKEDYLSSLPNVAKLFTAGYKDNEGNLTIDLFISGAVTNPSVILN